MSSNFISVRANETGETRLDRFEMSIPGPDLTSNGGVRILRKLDVPALSARFVELPQQDTAELFHPAPRRQLVVFLQGELVVTTTNGDSHRFTAGDCLFADDMASDGHKVEVEAGANLVTLQIPLPGDWDWPADSSVAERQ